MKTQTKIVADSTDSITPIELLDEVVLIAQKAGNIINDFRSKLLELDFDIRIKANNSPVTQADIASSKFIVQELHHLTPHLAVVSEENSVAVPSARPYWVIDPLDGTKIFLNGGTGFAVNIALIMHGSPVLGVVECPALDTVYYSAQGMPSFKRVSNKKVQTIQTRKQSDINTFRVAFDGIHGNINIYQKTQLHLAEKFNLRLPKAPTMERDAPLNILVAEGAMDIHVKTGRDPKLRGSGGFSWDNAADHIILKNAGGGLVDLYNFRTGLKPYHKTARNRMHGYMAMGDRGLRDKLFPPHA